MNTKTEIELDRPTPRAGARPVVRILSRVIAVLLLLPAAGGARASTNDVGALLQKGLFEEEANRNLDAAIKAYQAVIDETGKNHQFAATAIFRLAECYRKLGRTREAAALYERILREFPDQTELVKLSEQQAGHPAAPPTQSGAELSDEFTKQILAAQTEAGALRRQLEELNKLKGDQLRVAIQQGFPNPILNSLMQKLTDAQQELTKEKLNYGDANPNVKRTEAELETIVKQIDAQTDGVLRGLTARMQAAQDSARELTEARLQQARLESPPAEAPAAAPAETADPEAAEIKRIQALIKDSPDLINAFPEQSAREPLHEAVSSGWPKVVTFLLDHKADIEAREKGDGDTPLLMAARRGNKELVEMLLQRGADVHAENMYGYTPLALAAGAGYKAIAETLLAHGAKVDSRDKQKATPLHLAAQKGFNAVAQLLLARGADPNAANQNGVTPLWVSSRAGNLPLVEMLLANKADVDSKTTSGDTPLSIAVSSSHPEVVKMLIAHGADVNAANKEGVTPLLDATRSNNKELVALLLANKASVDSTNTAYGSPLSDAVANNREDLARLLIAHGANVNTTNKDGTPPLYIAS